MSDNLNRAILCAFEKDLLAISSLEAQDDIHIFSNEFENNISHIVSLSKYQYVSVGHRRIRKSLIAILVAALAIIITGCAFVAYYYVQWDETPNEKNGTVDINFEIKDNSTYSSKSPLPTTPTGYSITSTVDEGGVIQIEYSGSEGHSIYFDKNPYVENMGLSVDNEDTSHNEITIAGLKAYSYYKDGFNHVFWADTEYFYFIQGDCDEQTLVDMANSLY